MLSSAGFTRAAQHPYLNTTTNICLASGVTRLSWAFNGFGTVYSILNYMEYRELRIAISPKELEPSDRFLLGFVTLLVHHIQR